MKILTEDQINEILDRPATIDFHISNKRARLHLLARTVEREIVSSLFNTSLSNDRIRSFKAMSRGNGSRPELTDSELFIARCVERHYRTLGIKRKD